MKKYLVILLCLFFACAKDNDVIYHVDKGSSWVLPYIKEQINRDSLTILVTFDQSCIYPALRDQCEGDFNKLLYFGDLNPHASGAAFVWRCVGSDRHLEIGWYLWYQGQAPFKNGTLGVIDTIYPGVEYKLAIALKKGISWYYNDRLVKRYDDRYIFGRWISQGWFGGADDQQHNCNATQRIEYRLRIIYK